MHGLLRSGSLAGLSLLLALGCGGGSSEKGETCSTSDDCEDDLRCIDAVCLNPEDVVLVTCIEHAECASNARGPRCVIVNELRMCGCTKSSDCPSGACESFQCAP